MSPRNRVLSWVMITRRRFCRVLLSGIVLKPLKQYAISIAYVEGLSPTNERRSQILACSSVLVGVLTLFPCVATVSICLRIARSDVLPLPRPAVRA